LLIYRHAEHAANRAQSLHAETYAETHKQSMVGRTTTCPWRKKKERRRLSTLRKVVQPKAPSAVTVDCDDEEYREDLESLNQTVEAHEVAPVASTNPAWSRQMTICQAGEWFVLTQLSLPESHQGYPDVLGRYTRSRGVECNLKWLHNFLWTYAKRKMTVLASLRDCLRFP